MTSQIHSVGDLTMIKSNLCSVCSGSFSAFWLFQGEVTAHSRKYDDDNDDIYDNDNNDNDDNVGYV